MALESFKVLGICEEILRALESARFSEPTEIQEKAIPLALKGKDVIGSASTGSGKTLAFGTSIIQKSEKGKGIQALIITPTRELAEQVARSIKGFSQFRKMNVVTVYGGVAMGPQVWDIKQAEVIVGTPGRILDHLQSGTLFLSKVKTLVLDEADRMLDMGFIEDVEKIISQCPKERQTFLFSATMSPDISRMAKKYMNSPIEVSAENQVDPSKLTQIYYDVDQHMKFSLLVHLLSNEHSGLVMIFCNTRRNADFIAHNLQMEKIDAMAIHGGLTQARRNKIMEYFHSGRVFVLVCTDVAARGLDIKNVSHVYNYDLPPSSKEYIHRIGRTARAGKEGMAISLVSSRDYLNFRTILDDEQIKITENVLPADIKPLRVSMQYGGRGPVRRERSWEGRYNGRRNSRPFRGRDGGRGDSRGSGRNYRRRDGNSQNRREGSSNRSYGNRQRY